MAYHRQSRRCERRPARCICAAAAGGRPRRRREGGKALGGCPKRVAPAPLLTRSLSAGTSQPPCPPERAEANLGRPRRLDAAIHPSARSLRRWVRVKPAHSGWRSFLNLAPCTHRVFLARLIMLRSALLNVMIKAAHKASRALKRDFGEIEHLQVSVKGPADFATAADRRAEETLRQELELARPGYSFLGEEGGRHEGTDQTHCWIVDPLDGTLNFLHGIPHFAISIALEREGMIVAGLVYNPATDELFTAERGKGTFLNDRRLRVAARKRFADSVVACALPHPSRGDAVLARDEHVA